MCMHMSENMPGASRVNMLVMVISSKIDCKEIYLKNVFTMRDYLKRFVTQWVCIRLIICQQSHVWFCWSSNLKAKLIAKPNMYKFFIVFEKKWEKNVIKKLMLEFSKGWYITSSLFSNLDLYAFCLNSGSICTRLNVRL